MESYGVIYRLRNMLNGKCYIGQHVNSPKYSLEKRMSHHRSPRSKCTALRNAIQKYGWDMFEQTIAFKCF